MAVGLAPASSGRLDIGGLISVSVAVCNIEVVGDDGCGSSSRSSLLALRIGANLVGSDGISGGLFKRLLLLRCTARW